MSADQGPRSDVGPDVGRAGGPSTWAYVALGGNLGTPDRSLRTAAARLAELGDVMARSSLYATSPVGGPAGQPEYLNAVIALAVGDMAPSALLEQLLRIESEMGRVRGERWGPRLIDLDLLAVGDAVVGGSTDDGLVLPHPRLHERAFVLVPLCELASRRNESGRPWVHPVTGLDPCAMLASLCEGAPPAQPADRGVRRTSRTWGLGAGAVRID